MIDTQYLQEYLGRVCGPTPWRVVSQHDIDQFAAVTGDDQWIHVDIRRARQSDWPGAPIVQGNLLLSLAEPLAEEALEPAGFTLAVHRGWKQVSFHRPVTAGSRVRASVTPRSFRDIGGGWHELEREIVIEAEGEPEPAVSATSVVALLVEPT